MLRLPHHEATTGPAGTLFPCPGPPPHGGLESDPGGDESLSEAFWGVARQLRQQSRQALAPWDIAPAHLRALRVLMPARGDAAQRAVRPPAHRAALDHRGGRRPRGRRPGPAPARPAGPAGHPGRPDRGGQPASSTRSARPAAARPGRLRSAESGRPRSPGPYSPPTPELMRRSRSCRYPGMLMPLPDNLPGRFWPGVKVLALSTIYRFRYILSD